MIRFDRVNNFRDYGDLPSRVGGRVRKGRLFRSAHLSRASEDDVARLAGLGLATVADLRHPGEQAAHPSRWLGEIPVKVIDEPDHEGGETQDAPHIDAFRKSDFSAAAMRDLLAGFYSEMPFDPRHIALFSRYFDALATNDGGMLIHCAAGKDRTGILAWLTHHILGVHPDDAMEDYLLSNDAANIAERLPGLRIQMEKSYGRPITEEAILGMLRVDPRFIDGLLDALAARFGSTDGYLVDALGVDPARQEAIRARLLV